MKILKVYDKVNRNVFVRNTLTGDITIREYNHGEDFFLIINTKIYNSSHKTMAYFSYRKTIDSVVREELDIAHRYMQFKERNEKGQLIQSQRVHTKDIKSFIETYRLYDGDNEFIEIENHKGKRTINFKVKNSILINFLNLIENGKQ